MAFTIERNGYITFQSWVQALSEDLKTNGFNVINVDGNLTDDVTVVTEKVLFQASLDVDPLGGSQPWSIALFYSEADQYVDFYVCTPDQIIDSAADFRVARKRVGDGGVFIQTAGKLTFDSLEYFGIGENQTEYRFFSFEQWEIPASDTEANPLSYRLVLTEHGISLQVWVESYDSSGDKFAWFVVQRMVDTNGNVVVDGKAPLFALFSNRGYADSNGEPDPRSIMKLTVREKDVNSPTFPVTALQDTADSSRIINGAQQVSIREGNTLVMFFPNDLNTQRYKYPHQLDMIGAISSDVVSQSTELTVPVFGEPTPRVYRGMNADREFNRGVRILFWVRGGTLS